MGSAFSRQSHSFCNTAFQGDHTHFATLHFEGNAVLQNECDLPYVTAIR